MLLTWMPDLDLLQVPVPSETPTSLPHDDVLDVPHINRLGSERVLHATLKIVVAIIQLERRCVVLEKEESIC